MVGKTLRVSERRTCRVLGQARTIRRRTLKVKSEEESLAVEIVKLATRHERYEYRRIAALPTQEGLRANHERAERIWRKEGFKVLKRQLWILDVKGWSQIGHKRTD